MDWIVEHLCREWRTLKGAPLLFFMVSVAALFLGWQGKAFLDQQYIESLEARTNHAEVKLDNCQEALSKKTDTARLANNLVCPDINNNKEIASLSKKSVDCQIRSEILSAQLEACATSRKVVFIGAEDGPAPWERVRDWWKESTYLQIFAFFGGVIVSILALLFFAVTPALWGAIKGWLGFGVATAFFTASILLGYGALQIFHWVFQ